MSYVTCPNCQYRGDREEFDESLSCEAWCPKCHEEFLVEMEDWDEDKQEDEEVEE